MPTLTSHWIRVQERYSELDVAAGSTAGTVGSLSNKWQSVSTHLLARLD
jgi:hypothetical protein